MMKPSCCWWLCLFYLCQVRLISSERRGFASGVLRAADDLGKAAKFHRKKGAESQVEEGNADDEDEKRSTNKVRLISSERRGFASGVLRAEDLGKAAKFHRKKKGAESQGEGDDEDEEDAEEEEEEEEEEACDSEAEEKSAKELLKTLYADENFDFTGDHCEWSDDDEIFCNQGCVVSIHFRDKDVSGQLFASHFDFPNLRHIDFSGTNVSGHIAFVNNLTKLVYLNLENTQVRGDLENLVSLPNLDMLYLSGTHVGGDIGVFQKWWPSLSKLHLDHTKVHGDIQAFHFNKKLVDLNLANTKVFGDIKILETAPQLAYIDLSNTKVQGAESQEEEDDKDEGSNQNENWSFKDKGAEEEEGDEEEDQEEEEEDGRCDREAEKMSVIELLLNLKLYANYNEIFDFRGDHCQWREEISCHEGCVVNIIFKDQDVSGELRSSAFQFPNLHSIDFSGTRVKGDLMFVNGLVKLVYLNLANTQVRGNLLLSFGSGSPNLERLYLSGAHIRGDIKVFQEYWPSLLELHLDRTKVDGDIQAFHSNKKLVNLTFANTKVSGDIKILETVPQLAYIDLSGTKVQGDIKVFQACVQLVSLSLEKTYVQGDIQAFQATRDLVSLDLQGTHVFGDIIAFNATDKIQWIGLDLTHASGDIAVFRSTKFLKVLSLASTQVFGDIKAFEATEALEQLDLSSTKVAGDIQVFKSAGELKHLHLSATEIFGDIAALTNASTLQKIYLGQTNVSGNISALWTADMLREVQLASTHVYGDIQVFKGKEGLEKLLCSATQIEGDVTVFADMEDLEMVDLSLTNVTGDIAVFQGTGYLERLVLASTLVFGDIERLVPWGQGHPYEVIDLSRTNILGNIWVFQNANDLLELYLADTKVAGSIDGILKWEAIRVVDLSRTQVTGELQKSWRGCCKHLQVLKLSDSRVHFVPQGDDLLDLMDLKQMKDRLRNEKNGADNLLPALTSLEVSGCQLNVPVQNLILPLAACEHLGTIKAANCGLQNELPSLDPMPPTKVDKVVSPVTRSYLASSLETLDLSGNNLSHIAAVPPACQYLKLSSNQQALRLAQGELSKAVQHNVLIDLRDTKLHTDTTKEAKELLAKNFLQNTSERVHFRPGQGYSCYDLNDDTNLRITPSLFLPEEWCACMPGWSGSGTKCEECEENTFSVGHNAPYCTPCPESATSAKGSKSVMDCECPRDEHHFHKLRPFDGNYSCDCPANYAIDGSECVDCRTRNLNCSSTISLQATSAKPLRGFARLQRGGSQAFACLAPATVRCPGQNTSDMGCAKGYAGSLCMRCEEQYYAAGNACVECSDTRIPAWMIQLAIALLILAFFAIACAGIAYTVYSWNPGQWFEEWLQWAKKAIFSHGVLGSLQQELVKRQLPILLQMVQLWSVLAALASNGNKEASPSKMWELPYVQQLQFALGSLQEVLYLQCVLGGPGVRLAAALVTPVIPLLMLLCCVGLECFKRGSGVNVALKVLAVFFIGGASACMALRSCQHRDAGGEQLGDLAFLRQLPDLDCNDETTEAQLVSAVFRPCAACYGVLIPCFLFYLYTRQHVMLRNSRMPLELQSGLKGQNRLAVGIQDLSLERRLIAASVAYVAVMQHGSVKVQLQNGKGMVTLLDREGNAVELDVEGDNLNITSEAESLRHHAITEMLLEDCILEEIGESDRVLFGARDNLSKYATCRDLWMEVVLKLVAVALVKVVAAAQVATGSSVHASHISLGKVMAITFAMAGVVWMVQPYAQPQVNHLQLSCFLCLGIAAAGFSLQEAWLSRLALLMPLLLAAGQQLQPDSPESLARRLWKELLEGGSPKDAAETSILSRRRSETVRFRLEREARL